MGYVRGRERGVTLVELLVTIIIAAIFFALAVPLFVLAQKQSSGDRARVIAANVAQAELESVRSLRFADLAVGTTTTQWPNDEGGPVKVYSVTRVVENVTVSETDTTVIYKMVTVDVSWTPPPSPVKHVVFKTAIYPQYKGPEIVAMDVATLTDIDVGGDPPVTEQWLLGFPVTVRARVNSLDLSGTDYVRFAANATNGSFATYADVQAETADADGWVTWVWAGENAGDGMYRFTAVAVSNERRLGEYWRLEYMLDAGPPAAPGLAPQNVQAGDGVVSVRWSPPDPVAGDLAHYVLVRTDGAGGSETFAPLSKVSTTYIDRDVTNGVEYSYTVYAVDERDRTSLGSATASATPAAQADTTAPSTPTGLAASLIGQNVTLTWSANPAADGVAVYRVYRSDDTARTSPIAVITASASQATYSYTDPRIGWDRSFTYFVTAVDAALNESPEASTSAVTTPSAPPEDSFGLTVKVTGNDAIVMVASLETGSVYDIRGEPIVEDRSVSPILVKSNQKQGVTFSNLLYSTYRVTVVPVDNRRQPIGDPVTKDVELVRNETITFAL